MFHKCKVLLMPPVALRPLCSVGDPFFSLVMGSYGEDGQGRTTAGIHKEVQPLSLVSFKEISITAEAFLTSHPKRENVVHNSFYFTCWHHFPCLLRQSCFAWAGRWGFGKLGPVEAVCPAGGEVPGEDAPCAGLRGCGPLHTKPGWCANEVLVGG